MVLSAETSTSTTTLTSSALTRRHLIRPLVQERITKDDYTDGSDSDTTSEEHPGILSLPGLTYDKAELLARRVWDAGCTLVHHHHLPHWLRDNEFIVKGHRPPLNSYWACFKSIFSIHSETGNIWSHLIGSLAFLCIATWFFALPGQNIPWQDKAVFSAFFAGAIICMGFSWVFHTVICHSENVRTVFIKLDYCGIALLTVGSFIPWLYYTFFHRVHLMITYMSIIGTLGAVCVAVSMMNTFAQPKYRALRAGVFVGLGLSGVFPATHYVITDGFWEAINEAGLAWLGLMAVLYIVGAAIYACRIPERIWPGKFDIWLQSHQIFHMFVIVAAFVHFHGISKTATYRLDLEYGIEAKILR